MIKIGICDDEKDILDILKNLIQECIVELREECEIYAYCHGEDIFSDAEKLDLVFLDIEMPEMDGIQTGKSLKRKGYDGKIIMATAMVERFKEAFSIEAFRFVTKPFEKEEILQALEDFMKTRLGSQQIIVYKERNEFLFLQKDILYVYAINSAVELYMKKGIFRKESSLSELEEILDSRMFFRISKQCIVNMQEISEFKKGIVIIKGEKLKVSVRKKKEFEKVYTMFDVNYR